MIQTKGKYVYDVKKIVSSTQETTFRVIADNEEEAQQLVESSSSSALSSAQTDFQGQVQSTEYIVAEVALIVEGV
jgi:hypothetical protein